MLNELKCQELMRKDFVPEKIIDREKQKNIISEWFSSPLKRNLIILSNETGTGKTTLIKWILNKNEDFKSVYVLCRGMTSEYRTLRVINQLVAEKFNIDVKKEKLGDKSSNLLFLRKVLNEKDRKFIVCLDEIDALVEKTKSDDLINDLLHIQREVNGEMYIILISNDYFIRNRFSYITTSRLNELVISFEKYAPSEGAEILKYYTREYGLIEKEHIPEDNILTPKLLKFIKLLNVGDMRKLLRYFITWMERCSEKKKLFNLELVDDEFFDTIMRSDVIHMINSLSEHEQIILMALIKSQIDIKDFDSKHGDKKYPKKYYQTDFQRLYEYYCYTAKMMGVEPLKKRRMVFYLYSINTKSKLIEWAVIGKGRGLGVSSVYYLSEIVNENFEDVIQKLEDILGVSEDWVFNTNLSAKIIAR